MKRFCMVMLALLLVCAGAQAETAVVTPFAAETGEARLAAAVSDALGLPCAAVESSAEAANRMLADPGVLLCDTQAALIAGLQGYTDEDLRQEMTPVCRVARCPLFLVMNRAAAAEYGIEDAASFMRYIEANEYEFLLARHITADPADRAATKLSDEIPVLTDYYLPEEIEEALQNGEVQCAVMDGAQLRASEEDDLLILCALGEARAAAYPEVPCAEEAGLPVCQDIFMGLYMAKNGDAAVLERAAALSFSPEAEALFESLGYEFSPAFGDAFAQEIRNTFADYKAYMTAEGLFFYEE